MITRRPGCARLRNGFARETNCDVKLFDRTTKLAALVGIGVSVVEALFRVNLAKHLWLIGAQTGLALIVIAGVAAGIFHRNARSARTASEETPKWPADHSFATRAAQCFQMSNATEFVLAATLFGLLIGLTVLNVLRQTVDSDEPQHLHTIWAWTRGYVQYRDLFDNHMPLFHMLFAPIFALAGERATIVYWMRFALLPMNFVAAWCTYRIGATLFSRRAGIWAMLGVGLFSGYYRDVTVFAPSNLWLPLWLLCIVALIGGTLTVRPALVAGVLLGFCFAVSQKSVVFLVSVAVSAFGTLLFFGRKRISASWLGLSARGAAFLLGTILVPAIVMIFFASMGVWREFRYDVFDFTSLANQLYKHRIVYNSRPLLAIVIVAMILPPIFYVGRCIRVTDDKSAALRRVFILFVCASYFIVMQVFWLPISRTYRPIFPLVFVLLTGALLGLPTEFAMRSTIRRIFEAVPVPAFVALAEFLFLLAGHPFLKASRNSESELLRQVLALTTTDDWVLDPKGETIFRKRTSPLIMERITSKVVQRGILIDDAPQRCLETRTCVVAAMAPRTFSAATREFVQRNYLPVSGTLRIAGARLIASPANSSHYDFNVGIPASYQIISAGAPAAGTLDGLAYNGAIFLQPGRHTFDTSLPSANLVCLWSRAVERHFRPLE